MSHLEGSRQTQRIERFGRHLGCIIAINPGHMTYCKRCLSPKMGNRYISIILSVLTGVFSSYGSQVITTSFGKTATLKCQIANLGSDLQFLYWRKDGTTIYSLTSSGEHNYGKYSVIDTASLVIPDVMESDAGNYSCKVVRQSFATEESGVMQLYLIDVSVSHCEDTGQEVDGCSCNINGSNITSLGCSASGFPHPPVITWEDDTVIYRSSSIDLNRFSENITLACKARDKNLKGAVANKTVCVYYAREVTSTGGSPVETTTASVNDKALVAAILVSIILILVLLTLLIRCLAAACRRKTGKSFRLPPIFTWTSTPRATGEPYTLCKSPLRETNGSGCDAGYVDVLKDSLKHVVDDEQQLPSVGLVLLDDLRSVPEETKESIKAAVVALVVDSNKVHQSHMDPIVSIHSSFTDMDSTLKRNVKTRDLGDPDAAIVDMVIQDLDKILDERDRDECEILITKPDFQEVTDESEIPAYQGNRVIHQSLPMQASMTSSTTSSVVACDPLSTVLREELVKEPFDRDAIRNAISQFVMDFLKTLHSGLKVNSAMFPRSDSDPVVQTRQEEEKILDTPSTAKLLEDKMP